MPEYNILILAGRITVLLISIILVACDGHPPPASSLPPPDASFDGSLRDLGTDARPEDGGLEDAPAVSVDAGPIYGISCKQIHELEPTWGSACYTIDPDGPDGIEASYLATCDMTTMGGGWTLVFIPHRAGDYRESTLGYTYNSPSLFAASTEVLVAQRNLGAADLPIVTSSFDSSVGTQVARGNPVRFLIPAKWRIKSPFEYTGETETIVITTETGITISSILKYGYLNWWETPSTSYDCARNWLTGSISSWHGRLCVIKAPGAPQADPNVAAFWGFGADGEDTCNSGSNWSFAPDVCSQEVAFTIAIR